MSDQRSANTTTGTRRLGPIILAAILTVIALIFVFSNSGTAQLRFLMINLAMPGWAWVLVLLLIGFVIGSLFPWFRSRKK